MTPGAIKRRYGIKVGLAVAVVAALYSVYGIINILSISYTKTEQKALEESILKIKENTQKIQNIRQIISENKATLKSFEEKSKGKLINIETVQNNLQQIANKIKETNSFIGDVSVSFEQHNKYINAGKANFIFKGKNVGNMQEQVDEATATLVYPFIDSMKKEFHVYKDTLQQIPNSGIITYLYIQK